VSGEATTPSPRSRAGNALSLVGRVAGRRVADALGAAFALLYGLPSLLYPLGPDQALFWYMGQLWLSGGLPYRDAVDQKPPGIFVIYAVATGLLGPNQWAVHVFELAGVLVAGWLIARIVSDDGHRPPDGVFGLGCVLASVSYYTSFDYWSTGQVEFWQGLFSLASLAVVARGRRLSRAALVGGAFAGLATTFKPSLPLVLVVGVLVVRALRRLPPTAAWRGRLDASGRAVLLYCAGAALALALIFLPFVVAPRGLVSLRECVIEFTKVYTTNWGEFVFDMHWARVGVPVTATYVLTLAAFAVARREGDARASKKGLLYVALVGFAVLTVAAQRKFFAYHWVVVAPFLALTATWGLLVLCRSRRWPVAIASASAAAFVLGGVGARVPYHSLYSHHVFAVWEYVRGASTRETFLGPYVGPFGSEYPILERFGLEVAARAKPGDTLCVRGYLPAIYVVSRLRCPSRLPWEQHIGVGAIQEGAEGAVFPADDVRERWRLAHAEALAQSPPTFIVTFSSREEDRTARAAEGYREVFELGGRVLLERSSPDP
jgi:hypothetical protein